MRVSQNNQRLQKTKYLGSSAKDRVEPENMQRVHRIFSATPKGETSEFEYCSLDSLGFKNRGQKIRTGLYELRNTKMKSMIVETCFVEATEDVALYNKLGYDKVGQTIAEAIANKKVSVTTSNTTVSNSGSSYRVKIKADVLNVRKGAGTNYAIATTVKKNEVYTIVEEKMVGVN